MSVDNLSGEDRMMMGYTYPDRIGAKHTGYRRAPEIAKDIRADVKVARAAGDIPADVRVSVRCYKYSMGQGIDVTLSGWDRERVWMENTDTWDGQARGYRLTPEAERLTRFVEGLRSAYNRDRSDAMTDYFDVTYSGTTQWDWTYGSNP